MLWFLSFAVKHGFVVDTYHDAAEGVMGKNPEGKLMMTTVTLPPEVKFSGASAAGSYMPKFSWPVSAENGLDSIW